MVTKQDQRRLALAWAHANLDGDIASVAIRDRVVEIHWGTGPDYGGCEIVPLKQIEREMK